MEDNRKTVKIAAVGDIHIRENDKGKWRECFIKASQNADILLISGDLTDTGSTKEAEVLKKELQDCTIPIVAVLGNHDYERGLDKDVKHILEHENFHILDGEAVIIENIGFAGVKGFGGGFDNHMLSMFGEKMMKNFVQEAVDEALKLDRALTRLEGEHDNLPKIVVMHYAPIKATVMGEPDAIYPFLGCSRLAEPINRRKVEAVFHGHAHVGTLEGSTSKGVKVFNVAKPILHKSGLEDPFFLYEVETVATEVV